MSEDVFMWKVTDHSFITGQFHHKHHLVGFSLVGA